MVEGPGKGEGAFEGLEDVVGKKVEIGMGVNKELDEGTFEG